MEGADLNQQIGFMVVKIFFVAIGLLFMIVGYKIYRSSKALKEKGLRIAGTVLELRESEMRDRENGFVYHPVVEFKTYENRVIRFVDSVGSDPPAYQVGQMVNVIYDKHSPEKARIESFMSFWLLPLGLGIIGGMAATVGILLLVFV